MIATGRLCSQIATHRKYSTGNTASGIGTKRNEWLSRKTSWPPIKYVAVLDADGVVEPPHGTSAAPKVSEFPGLAECGRVPNYMIVNKHIG